ncbi:DNAH6 [Symbiodinium natans]|uniref:DNAH6 protein n=1 Tax=Symbiodinium natans TaxID=878477 RepID=A0A812QYT3_9DINO|nr:DNAH6 [Symbiodinium natans]
MGSGAQSKLSEASEEELAGVFKDLPAETQKSVEDAFKAAKAEAAPGLACRSASGEVTLLPCTQTWTYKEMAAALREKHPELKTQVIKFLVAKEPMDEYKTVGDLGLENEVEYTASEFSYGEKISMEEAVPLIEESCKGMDAVDKNGIAELKALKNPPDVIKLVGEAVACLLQAPHKTWEDVKKMMHNTDSFLQQVVTYSKDEVPLEALVELQWYLNHPSLELEKIKRASACGTGLMEWVKGIAAYAMIKKRLS